MASNILVASEYVDDQGVARLKKWATVHRLDETMSEQQLSYLLPKTDVLLVFSWPRQLTPEKLILMTRLRLVQNILAGVNQVPFKDLPRKVTV